MGIYLFCIFPSSRMVPNTKNDPRISNEIYQSGPLISTGKKVTGCTQVRKKIPDTNRIQVSKVPPWVISTRIRVINRTIQYTGITRIHRSI